MAKKRERLEIIYDILAVIRKNNNLIKPTKLLHSSNLSPQMFRDYIDELIKKKLIIQINSDKKIYSLSDKGFEFLTEYNTIKKFIQNFGL